MKLVIVESPTKSKTLQKFLKSDYKIASSYGHVRDLPKSKLGIDTENNFEPQYTINPKAKKTVKELKSLAKKSDKILLATDPDREGEAISWHLAYALKDEKKEMERISFNEITKSAIEESLKNPREIDLNLVNAQQARRVLDRLVGYKLSPFLWKKVTRGLSAGRVQSVALRFVVEREKEIEDFKKEEYWTIDVLFNKNSQDFSARLVKINEKPVSKFFINNKEKSQEISKKLEKQNFFVSDIKKKETKKNPLPPFITSTLQQEANKRLRFSSKQTMRIAQQLYEKGYTTYHRTDSYNLSQDSVTQAKKLIISDYGEKYWKGTQYKQKAKNTQEAHEAIRPSTPKETPEKLKNKLDKNQFNLYELIWKRFVASLMASAILDHSTLEIKTSPDDFLLKISGQIIKFDGFLRVYPIKLEEKSIPNLDFEEKLNFKKVVPEQHFTQPPARYNEASLIKKLEEKGIGRPSTYAPTISVIQERNYVLKNEEKRFYPTEIGRLVSNLLVEHFSSIVDIDFTAQMEESLDSIAEGKKEWKSIISDFYYPFEKNIKEKEKTLNKKEITEEKTDEKCEKCGSDMVIKIGRFGKFIACSNYPECKHSKPLEEEKSSEPCEKCGSDMVLKRGKFGSFWGCSNYPKCKNIRKDEKKTGVTCPECLNSDRKDNPGEIVFRKSKRGRPFYGCNRYPDCKFITNKKPEKEN